VNKEIKAEIIYEDGETIAFLDAAPLTPGHTLVIPKEHASNIIELSPASTAAVFLAAKSVTDRLNRALGPAGFTLGVNHGRISGQTINHFHLHIIPRYQGDGGKSIHSVVRLPVSESLVEIRKKIIDSQ